MRLFRNYRYKSQPDIARFVHERSELLVLWRATLGGDAAAKDKNIFAAYYISNRTFRENFGANSEYLIKCINDFIARWELSVNPVGPIHNIDQNDALTEQTAKVYEQFVAMVDIIIRATFGKSIDFNDTIHSSDKKISIQKKNVYVEFSDRKKFAYRITYGPVVTYEEDTLRIGSYTFAATPLLYTRYQFVGCHFIFVLEGQFSFMYHICTNTLSCQRLGINSRQQLEISSCHCAKAIRLFALRREIAQKAARFKMLNFGKMLSTDDKTVVRDFL